MDKVINILNNRFRHHPNTGEPSDYYEEIDDRGIWDKIQNDPRVWPKDPTVHPGDIIFGDDAVSAYAMAMQVHLNNLFNIGDA